MQPKRQNVEYRSAVVTQLNSVHLHAILILLLEAHGSVTSTVPVLGLARVSIRDTVE